MLDTYGKLKSGKIFGASSEQDRETTWAEVCRRAKDRLVPSFSTFFEDFNRLGCGREDNQFLCQDILPY